MNIKVKAFLLVVFILIPFFWVVFWKKSEFVYKELPKVTKIEFGDTIDFEIPEFSFTDQLGRTVTDKDFEGKIYIANFFFTSCPDICPRMTTNMHIVYEKFKKNPLINFVSYTVDPATDSVPQLKQYSERIQIDDDKWRFLTGEKYNIYQLAQQGYKVSVLDKPNPKTGIPDFIHSEKLILVDKEKKIRGKGWYDSHNMKEIMLLIDDIKILLKQYADEKNKR